MSDSAAAIAAFKAELVANGTPVFEIPVTKADLANMPYPSMSKQVDEQGYTDPPKPVEPVSAHDFRKVAQRETYQAQVRLAGRTGLSAEEKKEAMLAAQLHLYRAHDAMTTAIAKFEAASVAEAIEDAAEEAAADLDLV